MGPTVRTVSVGSLREGIIRRGLTAIDKRPVPSVEVRDPGPKRGGSGSGVVGDDIGSRRHHGGSRQAVYAVSREELDWWAGELGRDLRDGQFGENLTTEGLDVDGSVLGERWRVGTALLEVCGPRIPCATFAAWMDERQWVRRFSERGRTGAYLAVIEPGTMTAGDRIEVVRRPEGGVGVTEVFRALMGDPEAARRVLDAEELGADDRAELEASLTRRAPRPTDP
ncbi:MAG: MOSC domain-containing protein [Ornithinibacter sp.]